MLKNSIYSTDSLETLLLQNSLQSSMNNLNTITNTATSVSYADMLQSIKDKLAKKAEKSALEKADDEVAELEEKFDKELQQLRTEMAIYDMFHDAYITNGLFSNISKSRLRAQKTSMWNNIFSLQAERVQAQTQIAIQTVMRNQFNLIK